MAVSFVARKCTQCAGKLKYIKEKNHWCEVLMMSFWHHTVDIRKLRQQRFMPVKN